MLLIQHFVHLLALATTVSCSQKFSVYSDIFESPKYSIKYYQNNKITQETARKLTESQSNSSYELLRSSNQQFLCAIPEVALEEDSEDIGPPFGIEKLSQLTRFINEKLNNVTLFHIAGYFTYALSNNRKVEQFIGKPKQYMDGKVSNIYTLGQLSGRGVPNITLKRDGKLWSLASEIEDGTICDLTGKPRRVEIQYVCDPTNEQAALYQIYEHKTCEYVIQVSIPELCLDDFFRVHEVEVPCQELIDEKNGEADKEDKKPGKIHLSDYNLLRLSKDLFIAKPTDHSSRLSVLLDLDPKSGIMKKLAKTFFKSFHTKIASSSNQAVHLQESESFTYSSYVFDKFGNYLETVVTDYEIRDNLGHIVIAEHDDKFDLTDNFGNIVAKEEGLAHPQLESVLDHQGDNHDSVEEIRRAMKKLAKDLKDHGVELKIDEDLLDKFGEDRTILEEVGVETGVETLTATSDEDVHSDQETIHHDEL